MVNNFGLSSKSQQKQYPDIEEDNAYQESSRFDEYKNPLKVKSALAKYADNSKR